MSRIISVSRRTDVPAFYKDWFVRRLKSGLAGWENPFSGQKYFVSLKPKDVVAFVFWSKNYRPFLEVLPFLRKNGYNCLFHYTITGLPRQFETNLVQTEEAVDSFRQISRFYSKDHIVWRYDPIVVSDLTDKDFHLDRFAYLAKHLSGYTRRCYISFPVFYGKVKRNCQAFTSQQGIEFYDLPVEERIDLAEDLAEIAENYGIQVFSCCGDYLIGDRIKKGHCIDGDLISRLFYNCRWRGRLQPTRKECGCTKSTDIGRYDTCPHGCIYCYANVNKEKARRMYDRHDPESPFLGYKKTEV